MKICSDQTIKQNKHKKKKNKSSKYIGGKKLYKIKFLPRSHYKFIPGEVKGQLGVVPYTRMGESRDQRT